ncbi:MAG: EfeM/EfeO family lipoprotein [Nocardioides sp.]|uniref:iron uptake system protein EfeO n=1 Tax=Nocardioides sp. TaxID=35761 RepID=UPI0039E52488
MTQRPSRHPHPAARGLATASVAAMALLALAACGSSESTDSSDSSDSTGSASASAANASSAGSGAAQVNVTMVSGSDGDECQADTTSAAAGPVTFHVTNQSATGITEFELLSGQRIVGEKENLAPGLPEVSFTVTLGGGDYELYCPNAATEKQAFTVTGEASANPTGGPTALLAQGVKDYTDYVNVQIESMVTGVENLQKAIDSGNLSDAQTAYAEARPFYEKIESDVDGFLLPGADPTQNKGNLDYLIDMRASNLDPKVGWTGFHAVERDIFGREKITATTKKYAANLTKNVKELAKIGKKLTFKPEDLANGAAGLLEEVQANKITGEEEAYSHIDLVDFAGNVEGAEQAFVALQPGLAKIDADLTKTIAKRFAAVDKLLESYKDSQALGGYQRYTAAVKKADANTLSQTVQALQEPLSRLAEKVATAG